MQSLSWYYRRLQSMSPGEIAWRLQSELRNLADRVRFPLGIVPSPEIDFSGNVDKPGFRVSDISAAEWRNGSFSDKKAQWLEQLLIHADQILENKLTYFDLESKWHGEPFNWNCDHSAGIQAALSYAPGVDYRDFEKNGDCKLVWEPNRCHHLVVLGRAYRATGKTHYAEAVVKLIESWMKSNPFGKGMNWRSPMELSIRMINWVWAIDLIRDGGFFTGSFKRSVLQSVFLHLWEVRRKFSQGSSANNHVIGEAAGVFIAGVYFSEIKGLEKWLTECMEILEREIREQTFSDGCNKELALGYHLFVLQFALFSGIAGERSGRPFSRKYWSVIEKQLQFLGYLTEGGGHLVLYGDCDDGYVLDLGSRPDDPFGLLCIGAVLFERSDLKKWALDFKEPAWWLFGDAGKDKFNAIPEGKNECLQSRDFPEAGLYLLQFGTQESRDRASVLFDCGKLGYKSIAAHGHADALSFTLKLFGRDVFVDPGTYDYFSFPEWREYFRSTRAHNTVEIDHQDQSVILGPFMWGERARCECLEWQPSATGGMAIGRHDGYRRLDDPVEHTRTIQLDGEKRALLIVDELGAKLSHEVALFFHLSEEWNLEKVEDNECVFSSDAEIVYLRIDERLAVTSFSGSNNPIAGWVSRAYHKKTPSVTIKATGIFTEKQKFVTRITWRSEHTQI